MSVAIDYEIETAEQMLELGGVLADEFVTLELSSALVCFLNGNLGAGKTTLVRGILQHLKYAGVVKSPTYTIVESYQASGLDLHHFDLYRLADPEELEFLGVRDYLDKKAVLLIEWPEYGEGVLPKADLVVNIEIDRDRRKVQIERNVSTQLTTEKL